MEQSKVRELQDVVIRFSGDSGDGMQLTGTLFSDTSALLGNGISTFPDYPAEIRAPQGTVAGVSGFQVHFGDHRELNPGDYCDVLVAMNPAALKANRKWLKPGATVILDGDSITEEHLKKAGFATLDPLAELKLDEYNVVVPDITSMTREALKETGLDNKAVVKCKNMFALGICFWLFDRPEDYALKYLDGKFAKKNPAVAQANKLAIAAGYNYAANTPQFANNYTVAPAPREKGTYRSINGNVATAWGLCAAAEKAGLPLFCGSYPITPATVILEELAKRKDLITVAQWRKQAANGTIRNIPANGTVNKIDIPATKSQFEARKALVYLPPAALADSKRKPALPVVLMLSGQPGSPGRVFQAGGIQTMMDGYAKTHDGLAPIVIAADQLGADSHNTLCVDSKVYGNALTYLTQDVVDWVKTNLPAAQNAKDWAIAGFSQGATCSLQIGVNHPDLFGTMIPTDSEIKPTNGSRQEMIDRFFDGDTTAYENQVPVNAIRNHAPTHQMLIIGAGEKDTTSIRNVKTIAPVAAKAGMRVAAVESSGNAHDWHAVQDVLRYGLAVFGHDTGLDGANPNLSDYPNLKRITI